MAKWFEQALKQGAKAFTDGELGDANPFPRTSTSSKGTNRRAAWFKGYYEKRIEVFLQKLEERRTW